METFLARYGISQRDTEPCQFLNDVRLSAARDILHFRAVAVSLPGHTGEFHRIGEHMAPAASSPEILDAGSVTGRRARSPISPVAALDLARNCSAEDQPEPDTQRHTLLAQRKTGFIKASVISHLIGH